MTQREILALLDQAQTHGQLRRQIWDVLQAEARGNADQLTLPDKLKLDGVVTLLYRVFFDTLRHAPKLMSAYAPLFFLACSDDKGEHYLGRTPFDWSKVNTVRAAPTPPPITANLIALQVPGGSHER